MGAHTCAQWRRPARNLVHKRRISGAPTPPLLVPCSTYPFQGPVSVLQSWDPTFDLGHRLSGGSASVAEFDRSHQVGRALEAHRDNARSSVPIGGGTQLHGHASGSLRPRRYAL